MLVNSNQQKIFAEVKILTKNFGIKIKSLAEDCFQSEKF